jgi:hypothetical protein
MTKQTEQLQLEVDTAFLYESLANIQEDASTAEVLRELAGIEKSHVDFKLPPPQPPCPDSVQTWRHFWLRFYHCQPVVRRTNASPLNYRTKAPSGRETQRF